MIAELATDLLAKVKSVNGLDTRTSLTMGGRSDDPALLGIPLPAAWCEFKAEVVDEPDYTHGPGSGFVPTSQTMMATFSVLALIAYIDDADLILNQYPMLQAITGAVHGTEAGASGFRWRFIGQQRARVFNDRLAYEQRYTTNYVTNSDA